MRYDEYMQSELWFDKRRQRLEIDKYECRTCGNKDQLTVHHKCDGKPGGYNSYTKIPNESVEDDLTTLCEDCHEAITNAIRSDRYNSQAPLQYEAHKPPREIEDLNYEKHNEKVGVSPHRGTPHFIP